MCRYISEGCSSCRNRTLILVELSQLLLVILPFSCLLNSELAGLPHKDPQFLLLCSSPLFWALFIWTVLYLLYSCFLDGVLIWSPLQFGLNRFFSQTQKLQSSHSHMGRWSKYQIHLKITTEWTRRGHCATMTESTCC